MDINIINYSSLKILRPKLYIYIKEIINIINIIGYVVEKKGQKGRFNMLMPNNIFNILLIN